MYFHEGPLKIIGYMRPCGVFCSVGLDATIYNSEHFWTLPGLWDPSSRWDFTAAWEWGANNLPILKDMPGETQNHTVN